MLAQNGRLLREILSGVPSTRREVYVDHFRSAEALQGALNWYRAAAPSRTTAGQAQQSTTVRKPPAISTPTLYVWGEEDGAFSREAVEATAGFVSGSYEFHPLGNVGHWLPESAADAVTQLILVQLGRVRADAAKENYRAARRFTELAIDALGREAVLGFENLEAVYDSDGLARGQSRKPGPPFDGTRAHGKFLYERGGRIYHEQDFVNAGGTDRSIRRALIGDGSWNYWISRQLLTEIGAADVAFLRARAQSNMEMSFPHSLLRAALGAPASLRWLGEGEEAGNKVVRISFAEASGEVATLAIDQSSGLPVSVSRMGSDRILGDASYGISFADFQAVDGLQIPRRLIFSLDGGKTEEWRLTELHLNQVVEDARFARPTGIEVAPQPPRFVPQRLAPGVYAVRLYSGPSNSYNSMLVEFDDHVVVVEAPLVGAFFPALVQVANAVAPGKPIRAVVTTHHHHDHSGGAARFLAAGIDVIAPPDAVSVIDAMRKAHHTIAPALPEGKGGELIAVADSLVMSDGTRRLRLLQVGPSPHVDQMLVAHLPQENIIYVADLFAVPESKVYPPASATIRYFAELVDRFDLRFDTVVPTHGWVGSWGDLEAALAR
jgi:glyoxylase-like metal-dependent hydrolase (beta-lactamase superfamily II)